jgi:hypothetical protein
MTDLPAALVKRLSRVCVYSGCADAAAPNSTYCAPHDAHERGRHAVRQKRYRQRLAAAGRCGVCGDKVKRRRKPDGSWLVQRCKECKQYRKQVVTGDDLVVTGDSAPKRGIWRTEADQRPERAGQTTTRYVGHARRGRLTFAEQIDERIRDLAFAKQEIDKAARLLSRLKDAQITELPKIQRDAACREAVAPAGFASRILDGVVEELG